MIIHHSMGARLLVVFSMTYPPLGYDPVSLSINGISFRARPLARCIQIKNNYLFHKLTLLTSFLGLPNRLLDEKAGQSSYNIFCNLIGWQDNASASKKAVNFISVPIVTTWHLVTIVPRVVVNLVKLMTELLPAAFCVFSNQGVKFTMRAMMGAGHPAEKIFATVGYLAATSIYYGFRTLHFIGRAITSPILGGDAAFRLGRKLGERIIGKQSISATAFSFCLGLAFSLLSGAITTLVYTTMLPISLKLVAANVAPLVISHAPHFLMAVAKCAYHVLAKPLAVIGNNGAQQVTPLYKAVGIATTSSALNGVSFIMSEAGNLINKGIGSLISMATNWWRKPIDSIQSQRQHDVEVSPVIDALGSTPLSTKSVISFLAERKSGKNMLDSYSTRRIIMAATRQTKKDDLDRRIENLADLLNTDLSLDDRKQICQEAHPIMLKMVASVWENKQIELGIQIASSEELIRMYRCDLKSKKKCDSAFFPNYDKYKNQLTVEINKESVFRDSLQQMLNESYQRSLLTLNMIISVFELKNASKENKQNADSSIQGNLKWLKEKVIALEIKVKKTSETPLQNNNLMLRN